MAAGAILKTKSWVLIWNGEKCIQKWFSVIQNGRWQPFCEKNKNKSCVLIWNGDKCGVGNVIKTDFRSSKMAAGSHFVEKKRKLRIDRKWWEMRSKGIFGHPKWPKSDFQNGRFKKKAEYWSEMAINAFESDFRTLHTEARFVPDSPLPKLLFWLEFAPLRQFLKTYKNVSASIRNPYKTMHISIILFETCMVLYGFLMEADILNRITHCDSYAI